MKDVRRWRGPALLGLGLGVAIVLLSHSPASAATDLWGNVGPASPLGSGGLFGRYPVSHYALDVHFEAVEASLTGGVHVHGVPPMIAYVLALILWSLTSFLANLLITLFAFAFSLDLVNGSAATGGEGALGPVSVAIHSIYANVFGGPWLVLAITVTGLWAMWRSLVQRRHAETAGALALSLAYIVIALFFVVQPGATIGAASKVTNQMSAAFLAISDHGAPSGGTRAKDDAANQLFDLLVFKPWVALNFGGLEHCALTGTGSGDADPESAPVRPLSSNPSRDASLARRLAGGAEVSGDGKVCVNNAEKYASHFLRFALPDDARGDEYEALNDGDSSELPEADPERDGYRLGVADKPATDAMEEGGQFQRLGLALLVFVGELGAFCLLGSLAVGVILAQVLLLLLLSFAPVALVAAAIPGRGHAFFKGWLEKLAGYLLRKAAYSLVLAILLAVSGALAAASTQLGWLMSFGLQSLFFWAVFLQRKTLADGLIGVATGPTAPGRDASLKLMSLYAGGRIAGRLSRPIRRGGRAVVSGVGSSADRKGEDGEQRRAPLLGTSHSAPVGDARPSAPSRPQSAGADERGPGSGQPIAAAVGEGAISAIDNLVWHNARQPHAGARPPQPSRPKPVHGTPGDREAGKAPTSQVRPKVEPAKAPNHELRDLPAKSADRKAPRKRAARKGKPAKPAPVAPRRRRRRRKGGRGR
ncbi:MAG: type IV secretion system protein [Solirubrobacterales bacterium]